MSPNDFIENELTEYSEKSRLKKLILSLIFNPSTTIEFVDTSFKNQKGYGMRKMNWGFQIFFDSSEIVSGYLAHELLHVDLLIRNFPNHDDYYKNTTSLILKEFAKEFCTEIFNNVAHRLFYKQYISLGFNKDEFMRFYNEIIINQSQLNILCTKYKYSEIFSIKEFIEKYFTIKTDMNDSHLVTNDTYLSKLKDLDGILFNSMESLIEKIDKESDLSKIKDYFDDFYNWLDELISNSKN